jgi:hypothetical protein
MVDNAAAANPRQLCDQVPGAACESSAASRAPPQQARQHITGRRWKRQTVDLRRTGRCEERLKQTAQGAPSDAPVASVAQTLAT